MDSLSQGSSYLAMTPVVHTYSCIDSLKVDLISHSQSESGENQT